MKLSLKLGFALGGNVDYFIGVVFRNDFLQFRKVDSFRRRFDNSYFKNPILQMTVLPPFKQNYFNSSEEWIDEIQESLEGHFHEIQDSIKIDFQNMDFKTGRKNQILFLDPCVPESLVHAQEEVYYLLKERGFLFKKQRVYTADHEKGFHQTFLPIGKLEGFTNFNVAIETAKEEFELPMELPVEGLVLFERVSHQWIKKCDLFTFFRSSGNLIEERMWGNLPLF